MIETFISVGIVILACAIIYFASRVIDAAAQAWAVDQDPLDTWRRR